MSNSLEQTATLYKELSKTDVFRHLEKSCLEEANNIRKNASRSQDTAYGELKFADGIEWVLTHIKAQQAYEKIKK